MADTTAPEGQIYVCGACGKMSKHPDAFSDTSCDWPVTMGEKIAAVEKLAAEVNRDLYGQSLDARMAEAMRRNGGSMNPLWVREALIRVFVYPKSK